MVAVYPDVVDNAEGMSFWLGSVFKVKRQRNGNDKLEVVWYEENQQHRWSPMQLNRPLSSTTIGVQTVLLSGFAFDQNGCISPGVISLIEEAVQQRQALQQDVHNDSDNASGSDINEY